MPMIEGTFDLKTFVGEYDFAVDGGAVSTITLRTSTSMPNVLPIGTVVVSGYIEVDTPVTSGGAATVAVNGEAAGDLLAATLVSGAPWSTTGRKSIIPAATGATAIKTTAARSITVTVAVAALTAGKFRVVLMAR